jgi:tRNA(Arg) A34 adenosine deaminase TadA
MCAGSIYWSNIGRVVYGLSEAELLELTGDNPENMTLSMPCREIFNSGQKDVRVVGPFVTIENDEELKEAILADHRTFWK